MFIKFDFFFFYPYVTYLHFKCLKHLQTWNQTIMYANHDIQKCPMILKKCNPWHSWHENATACVFKTDSVIITTPVTNENKNSTIQWLFHIELTLNATMAKCYIVHENSLKSYNSYGLFQWSREQILSVCYTSYFQSKR